MIPKKIHYCWFGHNDKPKLAQKCIASWKKCCPDYEIIEWNESNFDVNQNGYTQMCIREKKYAFLSDYARLLVVAQYGGIYFDTDVELIKSPDGLLDNEAFFCFENNDHVSTGLGFGSVAHGKVIDSMLAEYNSLLDGKHGLVGCPILNTDALVKQGLAKDGQEQYVAGARILPMEYMNPYDSATGKLSKTPNTVSIHWYGQSWMSKKAILRSRLTRPFHRVFGVNCFDWLKKK